MNRSVQNTKSLAFCLLSLALLGVVTFGEAKAEAATPELPEITKLQRRAIAVLKDQNAKEAYEKRNAEITPCMQEPLPTNPGNAALLYYQAFLICPDANEAVHFKMHLRGEPDRQIRTYLGHCLPVIELAEMASQMPGCIWGLREHGLTRVALRQQLGRLQDILLMDVRALAADGHYGVALQRCMTVRRIAHQLSEDPELHIYSTGMDEHALSSVRYVLGVMPPDAGILTWLRGQFAVVPEPRPRFARQLQAEVRAELNDIRIDPARLATLRKLLVETAGDKQIKEIAQNLTDDQLLSRVGEELQRFLSLIFRILDSEMTYEQKRAEMLRLINKLREADTTAPGDKDIISLSGMKVGGIIERLQPSMIERLYSIQVGHQAQIKGIKAAVEVYLVLAKTGELPEKLPSHLPKDPFTGQDFAYEITDEGFALRPQSPEFLTRKRSVLEFRVRKK